MGEKHLTEKPWKDLVARFGLKDLGFQKALVAFDKLDPTKDPASTLEALKGIGELALKLKKTYASKTDVNEHLEEVLKEVKKQTPLMEAKIKAGETAAKVAAKLSAEEEAEKEEELEAAEFKKDLKKQMTNALAQVKLRAPGDPEQDKEPKPQLQFMACLAAKISSVLIAKKVGVPTKKFLSEIVDGVSGGKFVTGECIYEKNAYTFLLESLSPGVAKKLASALHAETGVKHKVRVRTLDGSAELDSDTDVDPEALPKPSATAAPTDKPSPKPPGSGPKLSAYMNAAAQWRSATATAENGVFKLKKAILEASDPELKDLVKAKIDQLNSILSVMDDTLLKKIEEARADSDDERRAVREAAVGQLAASRLQALRQHPLAAVADNNPFGTFTIRSPMEEILTKLVATFGG